MAESNQELMVVLGADITEFQRSMKNVQQAMEKTANDIQGSMKSAESSVGGSTGGMSKAFKGLGVTIIGAMAVDKIKDFGVAMVNATAEAQALEAQFEQVFGELGGNATKIMNDLGKEFGMLPARIQPSLTTMTSMFKGLGMDTETAMTTASEAVTLVADASAFYDKSFEDANSALNSFIKGNYEGGEAIGLFANETQMATWASENLGLEWKNLDEAGKQVARLEYAKAMQESAGATGQASRESDNLQNVLGNLQSAWQGFLAVVGEPLLALTIPVVKGLTSAVLWATDGVNGFFEAMKESSVLSSLKDRLSEIGKTLRTAFSEGGLSGLIESIGTVIPQLLTKGQEMITALLQGIISNIPMIAETILGFIQTWIQGMATIYPLLLNAGLNILNTLLQGITQNISLILESALILIEGIVEGIAINLSLILESGIQLVISLIEGIVSFLPKLIEVAVDLVLKVFNTIVKMLPKIIDAGIKLLLALIDGIVKMLPVLIVEAVGLIVKVASALIENLPTIVNAGIELIFALIKGLVEAIPQLVGAIPQIVEAIFNAFEEVDWGSIGKEIISGIGKGIAKNATAIFGTVKSIASNLLKAGKKVLDISSPSKVFENEVGKAIPQGIALGVKKEADTAIHAVEEMEDDLTGNKIKRAISRFPDFLSNDNSRSYENVINISSLVIREENDILKLAQELNRVMQREQNVLSRAGGLVNYGY